MKRLGKMIKDNKMMKRREKAIRMMRMMSMKYPLSRARRKRVLRGLKAARRDTNDIRFDILMVVK